MVASNIRSSIAILVLISFSVLAPRVGSALTTPSLFDSTTGESQEALEALALYPQDVRHAILEVALYSQGLVRIEGIRAWSERAFRKLVEDSTQDEQKMFWELVRYPGLVAAIVEGGRKSTVRLERIAARYPESIRADIVLAGGKHFSLLAEIDELQRETDRDFEDAIADYPSRVRQAFRDLLELPEVLNILSAQMRLTVRLGEAYERNPKGTEKRFAELNLAVARRQAAEREDWERELASDPALREEFEESTDAYAEAQGYDREDDPSYSPFSVHIYPYPYWFGYPYWMSASFHYPVWYSHYLWYPYPYWAHWGFHYDSHHQLQVFAAPSYFYLSWHLGKSHDYYEHHQLSSRFEHHFRHHQERASHDAGVHHRVNHKTASHSVQRTQHRTKHRTNFMSRVRQSIGTAPRAHGARFPFPRHDRKADSKRSHRPARTPGNKSKARAPEAHAKAPAQRVRPPRAVTPQIQSSKPKPPTRKRGAEKAKASRGEKGGKPAKGWLARALSRTKSGGAPQRVRGEGHSVQAKGPTKLSSHSRSFRGSGRSNSSAGHFRGSGHSNSSAGRSSRASGRGRGGRR